ncbi:uncharacterized protein LOC143849122 [Tasmannia lanceolata]|uniref:uncharacterized protein LOC143849122 n=1 Tax=Tasmannia lanceolata TaxID=3420 RepID=UPI00406342FA
MEMFYTANKNDISEKTINSFESSNKPMITRPPYNPLSLTPYLGPTFNTNTPDISSYTPTGIFSPITDPFISPATDSNPLHHHLRHLSSFSSVGSSSPLSSIENIETPPSRSPPVYRTPLNRTPVKVTEEEVLVMDEIPVNTLNGNRTRSSSDSGSSSANSLYKTEICRAWEDLGSCRYGSKCQFAHGKEELRPCVRLPKQKPEICVSFAMTGACIYGPKCRYVHHSPAATPTAPAPAPEPVAMESKMKPEEMIALSLADDATEARVKQLLYGPTRRLRRLSVFSQICPD